MTEKEKFISEVAKYVQKYAPKYSISVHSPIIAQAILESGWGKTKLASVYHNYFGLKCGSKWTGKSVRLTTTEEYVYGVTSVIKDNFRVYESLEDGIKGYFEFIQLERYHNLRGITDPEKYLKTILADGYATEHDYVTQNMALIKQYNLTQYDKEVKMSATTKSTITEKTIKICGHGSGNPSVKVMYTYLLERYSKIASNGKHKGVVCVKRLKKMDDAHRKQFHDTYKTILGRNIYSQNLRDYVYKTYNGKYYSDCSSSGMATMRKIGYDVSNLNTAGIYWSSLFEDVPVRISNGHILNPEILKVGDCLLFVGNDPSRPKQIGHVEYVYEINGEIPKETTTTGKSYTGSYPTLPSRGYFKNGDVSSEVIKVKKFLNWAIGSKLTETNKNYFDKTVAEVKKFQKKVGITADGEWGKNTQAKAKAFKK